MRTVFCSATDPDQTALDAAADVLRQGGVIAYATDTLYGLAVDPRRDDAVERLFEVKGRDSSVAIPLIASSLEQAQAAAIFGERELTLARAFWPGPLTIVLAPRDGLSSRVLAAGETVAVRVPAHAVARGIADRLGCCITATSANRSGQPPTSEPSAVVVSLGAAIDLLVDSGPAPGGPPSTILAIDASGPRLVRAGAIAWNRVLESLE